MEHVTRKSGRLGIRLLLGVIALLVFGYLVEIFIMGAPSFNKASDRVYDREKDPIPFWTQFAVFTVAGVSAAYFTINWKKGSPLIEGIDAGDRMRLEAMGPKYARKELRKRQILAVAFLLGGAVIAALLISLIP